MIPASEFLRLAVINSGTPALGVNNAHIAKRGLATEF